MEKQKEPAIMISVVHEDNLVFGSENNKNISKSLYVISDNHIIYLTHSHYGSEFATKMMDINDRYKLIKSYDLNLALVISCNSKEQTVKLLGSFIISYIHQLLKHYNSNIPPMPKNQDENNLRYQISYLNLIQSELDHYFYISNSLTDLKNNRV